MLGEHPTEASERSWTRQTGVPQAGQQSSCLKSGQYPTVTLSWHSPLQGCLFQALPPAWELLSLLPARLPSSSPSGLGHSNSSPYLSHHSSNKRL